MSKANSVKALRAKRAKRLAQKRGLTQNKGSSYHRPRTTFLQFPRQNISDTNKLFFFKLALKSDCLSHNKKRIVAKHKF